MKNRIFSIVGALVIGTALVLTGCKQASDSDATIALDDGFRVIGSASGRVIGPDGIGIPGILIGFNTGSRAIRDTRTNAQGIFEITGLGSGEYNIYVGGGGDYTTATVEVTVPDLDAIKTSTEVEIIPGAGAGVGGTGNGATDLEKGQYYIDKFGKYYVNENLKDVTIYPLSAKVTGIAYIEAVTPDYNKVSTIAPEGYTVSIRAAKGLDQIEGVYESKVGADGAFEIAKLPATVEGSDELEYSLYLVSNDNAAERAAAYKIDSAANLFHIVPGTNALKANLRATEPVNLGNVTFKAAIAPELITVTPSYNAADTFLPGTAAAPTPLVFTFTKAMATEKGTLKVTGTTNTKEYLVTKAWDATNTILTVTPVGAAFEYGETIKATFTNFKSADGVAFVQPTVPPLNFKVVDALKKTTTSWFTPHANLDLTKVAVDASPTITFNYPLTSITAKETELFEFDGTDWVHVDATFAIAGNVLTIDPVETLKYAKTYGVKYEVSDGITKAKGTTTTDTFSTVSGSATLTPVTLSWNSSEKLYQSVTAGGLIATSGYNAGETALYVFYERSADVDGTPVTYTYEYKKATEVMWTTVTGATDFLVGATVVNGNMNNVTITAPATWASSDEYSLRVRSSHAAAVADVVSLPVVLADTVFLPTGATIAGELWAFQSSTLTASVFVEEAATTLKVGYVSFDIVLTGELSGAPILANGTLTAADASLDSIKVVGNTATVRYKLPMLTTASPAMTYSGKTVTIILRDLAGNTPADHDLINAGNQAHITLTF